MLLRRSDAAARRVRRARECGHGTVMAPRMVARLALVLVLCALPAAATASVRTSIRTSEQLFLAPSDFQRVWGKVEMRGHAAARAGWPADGGGGGGGGGGSGTLAFDPPPLNYSRGAIVFAAFSAWPGSADAGMRSQRLQFCCTPSQPTSRFAIAAGREQRNSAGVDQARSWSTARKHMGQSRWWSRWWSRSSRWWPRACHLLALPPHA